MLPDAEVICIGIEILQQFPELGDHFQIKLSHRLLLDAILSICGVPTEKFRTTCSAIDKLDKEPWEKVYIEMVEEKGLSEEVANKIKQFVCFKGSPRELHTNLTQQKVFGHNQQAKQAMEELKKLFDYLDAMDVLDYISFDLSLARGLDYYTGLIYEFVLTNSEYHVGSIAAGGRYDNLVGMFSATGTQIPCVGVSMGIERIFGILQAHAEKNGDFKKSSRSQVLVASTGNKLLLPRLEICKELWRANISAEIMQVENPKFTKQLHYALEAGIPFMIVIGEDEIAKGEVKIKDMSSKEEIDVKRTEMVKELLKRNCLTTDILSV
jgi:histidyl-tRNA synthetase